MSTHRTNTRKRLVPSFVALVVFVSGAMAQSKEAHGPSQAAADVLREAAGAEIAFLPAGMIKDAGSSDDLASLLKYPNDTLSVVELRGEQIRLALEKSVALYPSAYDSFLQLSNLEVTFRKDGAPENRVVSIIFNGAKIESNRAYSVAMPSTLARGGLGYFRIWDKRQIKKTIEGVSLEDVLKGKRATESPSRYRVLG